MRIHILRGAQEEWEHPWPWRFHIINHVQWTRKMGLKVENILDFTNVPLENAQGKAINGIPDWFQLEQLDPLQKAVELTRDLQLWMFGLLREVQPGVDDVELKRCWANLTESAKMAFNRTGGNRVGENGEFLYRDYIMGTGLEQQEHIKIQYGISRGNSVLVLRPPFPKFGKQVAEIKALNAQDPKTLTLTLTYGENREVIYDAVNWHRYPLPFGQPEPFPYGGGVLPLLMNGTDKAYIDWTWLEPYGRWESGIRDPFGWRY